MSIVPVALPYTAPPPVAASWLQLEQSILGANGDTILLGDYGNGYVLGQGVRGLHMPPFEHVYTELAAHPGGEWESMLESKREVFWPLYVYSDNGSDAWVENASRIWKALNPRSEAVWSVRAGQRGTRRLRVRLRSDGNHEYRLDPFWAGWAAYGVYLDGAPFWEGDPVRRAFITEDPPPFTGVDGGPPFNPALRATISTARISNPGDVDASIVWTVEGPHPDGVSLGFDTYTIDVPFALTEGQTLTVDTRPLRQVALMQDGTDRTADLTPGHDLGVGLPPGTEIPLAIEASGTGLITATLTPLYWTAML